MENSDNSGKPVEESLLDAALSHVVFDGWSDATLKAAAADAGVSPDVARLRFPQGGVDLARAYHLRGDRAMVAALAERDMAAMRFRDRIALAVRLRLEQADRDAVRRGSALFALPQNMPRGAALIWGTADAIWTALGDKSHDFNWYSKRATLSAVYSATVLYWLGDDSEGHQATWDFLDRRIEDVMQFEKSKADLKASPLAKMFKGPLDLLARVKAPEPVPADLPGQKGTR